MTNSVLSRLAEVSVQSSLLIAVVLLMRELFRDRLDKRLMYRLWLPVMLRMLLPFSVSSRLSVMNLLPLALRANAEYTVVRPDAALPAGAGGLAEMSAYSAAQTAAAAAPARPFPWTALIICVWAAGAAAVALLTLYGNTRFSQRLKKGRKEADIEIIPGLCSCTGIKRAPKTYISDKAVSPCAVGIFRPAIYLPSWAVSDNAQLRYILMHELTHIKYRDNLLSLFMSACCAVYWFDPLVWIMAVSARRDRELACDARVTRGLNASEINAYGLSLVNAVRMQSGRCQRSCVPAFAAHKNELLDRISSIKSGRPAARWLTLSVCAVMACSFIAFGTSAKAADGSLAERSARAAGTRDDRSMIMSYEKPMVLGKVRPCDESAMQTLMEYSKSASGWMEIERRTDPDGYQNASAGHKGSAAAGSGRLYRDQYRVIEDTGVGRRIYIISRSDMLQIGGRLFVKVR